MLLLFLAIKVNSKVFLLLFTIAIAIVEREITIRRGIEKKHKSMYKTKKKISKEGKLGER